MTVWERLVRHLEETGERLVDLGSDQTSCHDPFGGGYYPVQLTYDEGKKVIVFYVCMFMVQCILPELILFHYKVFLVGKFVTSVP